MTAAWIVLLGVLHGLQPDHAAAASTLAARAGTSAWRAAFRVALGHAAALGLMALLVRLLPATTLALLESASGRIGGASLVVVGFALIFQAIRARYVVHAHAHQHDRHDHEHLHAHPVERVAEHHHRHAAGALAVGLALGLGGARSLLVLLPAMAGPGAGLEAVALYACGIVAGCVAVSGGVDLVRRLAGARSRWVDVAAGAAAMVAGTRLVLGV